MNILITFLIIIINIFVAAAQDWDDINIAKEYYNQNEYQKAKDTYAKLLKNNQNIKEIYKDYKLLLQKTKQIDDLEKFIKKTSKLYPNNVLYKIDLYANGLQSGRSEKSNQKELAQIYKYLESNIAQIPIAANYFNEQKMHNEALEVYQIGRKLKNERFEYLESVVETYQMMNSTDWMVNELLEYVEYYPNELEKVQNLLQINLNNDESYSTFEKMLYQYIQKHPNNLVYNELLYWRHIQSKKFSLALIQAKAIEKHRKTNGRIYLDLGKIALDNKKYEDAIKIYQTAFEQSNDINIKQLTKQQIIFSKEEALKNNYPIQTKDIQALNNDYKNLVDENQRNKSAEVYRKWARLKAFYLNNIDTAIVLLNQAIAISGNDFYQRDISKIDLADIYLLNNEPWEAILLYYQVEKSQKEQALGYEAKLKNAKASYFKGEFELAAEHLDVLKLATTREISNDALYMSLLIRDNLMEDSAGTALKAFSKVGLLEFQQKYQEAIDTLKRLTNTFPNSTITDDLYFLLGKLNRKTKKYQEAIESLEKVVTGYKDEILADDAVYLLAKIYEEDLNDTNRAMEYYQILLTAYSSSIYAEEARQKYRKLRGDKI